jgi:hypothetical protein
VQPSAVPVQPSDVPEQRSAVSVQPPNIRAGTKNRRRAHVSSPDGP